MPDFCTCGAQLPEDARFCHKCGKPQREEPLLVEEPAEVLAPPPPAAPPPPPPPAPIGWGNRTAVGSAVPAGILAYLVSLLLGPLGVIALVAAGALAVYLYRRRTGEQLSVMNGARLGWITGLVLFVPLLISFTATMVFQPDFFEAARQQMAASSLSEAEVDQALNLLRSPAGKTTLLAAVFLLSTLLPAFGGAIGAKLLNRH